MKHSIPVALGIAGALFLAACEPNPNRTAPNAAAVALREVPAGIDLRSGRLSLRDFTRLLAYADESIQAQALEVAISEQAAIGARGEFEPIFYADLSRAGELSQTSAADFLSTGTGTDSSGTPFPFEEYGTNGRIGVEMKDTTGVTVDLYYEMGKIANSLQKAAALASPEHSSAVGVTVRAPLARNSGRAVNTSSVMVADIEKEIAAETVRLLKTQRAFEGIKTYLFVQRAQQRVHWRQETARLAAQLEQELEQQVALGLLEQSVLTQAASDVAERNAAVTLARQELEENVGALQIYFLGLDGANQHRRWMPSDSLTLLPGRYLSAANLPPLDTAYARRPESKINALRIEREEILRLVAENQTMAEANLVLDVKKTQLSAAYIPFRNVFTSDNPYQTWKIGFEFRKGLGGNITEQAEYQAALLREKQAELTMRAYRQRVASELNGIGAILDRARENLRYQDEIIAAQQRLLDTESANAESGNSSAIDVLRARLSLAYAREARADAIAQLNLSSYLASQIDGTLLTRMGID
ncbi:Outer membrane protein TolC [Poseidonocella pacifica]|uniref:Outer membrane protein TolC n=1 Tax=Poseidonocella pacifica TaxID=871651 RepID=A0A1I0YCY6_9RHOB|nr:TolC family protein [Poseidonocella pacifica]SFB11229.1 Outer membrane protein TolC [Poseidonocella pacifica]